MTESNPSDPNPADPNLPDPNFSDLGANPLEPASDSLAQPAPDEHQAQGICRTDAEGKELIDALAGRASLFGFGFQPIGDAIRSTAAGYLGDGTASDAPATDAVGTMRTELMSLLGETPPLAIDSMLLYPSPDVAVESAICLARRRGDEHAFRTVALMGSDHGRTAMCRTASGRPELHDGLGPMIAGFAHVPRGDLKALAAVVDEHTACVLLSPIDLLSAAEPCSEEYLTGVRSICDQHDALLIIDETQLVFGSSGWPFAYRSLADIPVDAVVLAGGIFGGLPGGLVLASERLTDQPLCDLDRYPMLAAVASQTFASMSEQGLPESARDSMHQFAVALAEQLRGFEFVREVHASGVTIGIDTDIESNLIVPLARRHGLLVEAAGDTAIRLQLPLVIGTSDQQQLLSRLGETMEEIERSTATAEIGVDSETA